MHTMQYLAALGAQPRTVALAALVIVAAVCDWRMRRLPNVLTVGGALCGFAFALGHMGAGPTALMSLAGMGLGLVLLLPLWIIHVTGAGDVKLMAAIGAFVGPSDIGFAVLFTFIAGGVIALAWTAWLRALPRLAGNVRAVFYGAMAGMPSFTGLPSVGRMPYAIAVCAGTFACVWLRQPFSS